MRINESAVYANFRDPTSLDPESKHTKKTKKTAIFSLKIYLFAYRYHDSKTTWRAKLKFLQNVNVWRRPVTRPNCYRQKMGRKWTILNRYISVNTDFDGK